jgi:hypothetical protein
LKPSNKSFLVLLEAYLASLIRMLIGESRLRDAFGEDLWVYGTWTETIFQPQGECGDLVVYYFHDDVDHKRA